MKYIFLFICLCLLIPVSAQKINKDYLFYPQGNESLYFIYPQKGFKNADKTNNELVYDITYLTSGDSITFSFTYINKEICKPETLTFLTANNEMLYQGNAQMVFVQPKKKDWEHRATIKVPFENIIKFYTNEQPCQLKMHTNKKEILFLITDGKWDKQRILINRIFEIITNNN